MTLYTSDEKRRVLRYCMLDVAATVFIALFGGIYEYFSHDVYSYFMMYAFAVPLVLGVLPMVVMLKRGRNIPSAFSMLIYHAGLAALTVGSVFQGVLEIYGTTNRLIAIYPIVGLTLSAIGASELLRDARPEQVKVHAQPNK